MPTDRPWSDADREVVERAWRSTSAVRLDGIEMMISDAMRSADVLDALTAAGWRPPPPKPDGIHWRTGTSVGRTIYNPDGDLAGLVDTQEQARAVVAALNAAAEGGTDAR